MQTRPVVAFLLAVAATTAARAQEPPPPPPPEPAQAEAPADPIDRKDDVDTRRTIFASGETRIALGGLLQLHLAPYVGSDSLLDDGDVAQRAGFRLRRARLGIDAAFPENFSFLFVLNPLESDPETGTISEARLAWAPRRWFRVWAGADKVPFSHGELVSSADLSSIERPLVVRTLVPQRRLGAVIEGAVLDDKLSYAAGVMNSTEGFELGNQFSGLLYVARAAFAIEHFAAGLGGFFQDGAATNTLAFSADVSGSFRGASLLFEVICDRTKPDDSPTAPPEVTDTVWRCGGYVEAAYRLADHDLQAVVRVEYLDDHLDVDDAGDALLFSAGVNYRVNPHLRLQLHYLGRHERKSAERANDAVVLGMQGEL